MAKPALPISFNGKLFASINFAARNLNISTRQVKNALNDPTNLDCYILDILQLSSDQQNQIQVNSTKRGKDKSTRVRGKDHGNWVHGNGKTRDYYPKKYSAWINGVLKLYNWRCIVSGSQNDLECHHVIGWWYEAGRYDIYNGVPLSRKIHKKFHQQYGQGQNNKPQFELFLQNEYGMQFQLKKQHGNHEPSISISQVQEQQKTFRDHKFGEIKQLIMSRKHRIQKGEYQNRSSSVLIYCLKHGREHQTTFGNYKKSRTGMPCCSKERQKLALQARQRNSKGQVLSSKESKLD